MCATSIRLSKNILKLLRLRVELTMLFIKKKRNKTIDNPMSLLLGNKNVGFLH